VPLFCPVLLAEVILLSSSQRALKEDIVLCALSKAQQGESIPNSYRLPSLKVANHLQKRALCTAVAHKESIYLDVLVQTEVKDADPASKSSSLTSASFCIINQNQNWRRKKLILDSYHQIENEVYPVSHKSQTKEHINLHPDTFLPSIRFSIVLV